MNTYSQVWHVIAWSLCMILWSHISEERAARSYYRADRVKAPHICRCQSYHYIFRLFFILYLIIYLDCFTLISYNKEKCIYTHKQHLFIKFTFLLCVVLAVIYIIVVVFYVCTELFNKYMLLLSYCYWSGNGRSLQAGLSISRDLFCRITDYEIVATVRFDTFHWFGDYARMRRPSMFLTLLTNKQAVFTIKTAESKHAHWLRK